MLEIPKQTFFMLDYNELDELIHENTLHADYEFIEDNQCDNDSLYKFRITGKDHIAGDFVNIEKGDFKWIRTHTLLDYLCFRNIIPAGEYLISVSW